MTFSLSTLIRRTRPRDEDKRGSPSLTDDHQQAQEKLKTPQKKRLKKY